MENVIVAGIEKYLRESLEKVINEISKVPPGVTLARHCDITGAKIKTYEEVLDALTQLKTQNPSLEDIAAKHVEGITKSVMDLQDKLSAAAKDGFKDSHSWLEKAVASIFESTRPKP